MSSPFYLFGYHNQDNWLSWNDLELHSILLDIPTVPVLWKGICNSKEELKNLIEKLVSEPSLLGCQQKEGVVVRLEREFSTEEFSTSVLKWVRKDHVKTDSHWTRNWKKANIIYV